jgi:hypothetical protein
MKTAVHLLILMFISISVIFYSCGDQLLNPDTGIKNNLEFSYTSSKDTSTQAKNIITLDNVKILLKDVTLISVAGDSSYFYKGQFIVYLDMNNTVNTFGSGLIFPGSYDRIKFEVHKPELNEPVPDPEFRDSSGNYSLVVKGHFNGKRFTYKSAKSAEQILNFPKIITLDTTSRGNVTLLIRPQIWFKKNNEYLDPSDPKNSNDIDDVIKNNMNQNFKAFKDYDKNGIPDN